MPVAPASAQFDLPPLPPAAEYGTIVIDRSSTPNNQAPVTFSHWGHRTRHTCRVCHLELEFEMRVNATTITEEDNLQGKFCGACHNGRDAFGHTTEHCPKCHNGNIGASAGDFSQLAQRLPKAPFGNQIDWVQAIQQRLITPAPSLRDTAGTPASFTQTLDLQAAWNFIPPARFSHEVHSRWLDCANCHPDIFAIKRNATQHFEMRYILDKRFCGACHLTVAFPLNDCKRCHPGMKEWGQ